MIETLTTLVAVLIHIQKRWSNVIVESGSQITIQAIDDDSKALNQISNIIENIMVLAKEIRNIKFMYCIYLLISLADRIANRTYQCISQSC